MQIFLQIKGGRDKKQVDARYWCLAIIWQASDSRFPPVTSICPVRAARFPNDSKRYCWGTKDGKRGHDRRTPERDTGKEGRLVYEWWRHLEGQNRAAFTHSHRRAHNQTQWTWWLVQYTDIRFNSVTKKEKSYMWIPLRKKIKDNSSKAFQTGGGEKKRFKITWNSCISDLDYAVYKNTFNRYIKYGTKL